MGDSFCWFDCRVFNFCQVGEKQALLQFDQKLQMCLLVSRYSFVSNLIV
jgi:hypothetical protein